jgi:NEDD8-activating enzyme E1
MFSEKERGKFKAEQAARFIEKSYRKKMEYVLGRIQDLSLSVINRYDVLLCALDNIEGRMDMNYIFRQSTCSLLIDCGINGYKAHVKAVSQGTSCLYCIKDLYVDENEMNMCSLSSVNNSITRANRRRIIRSLIEAEKMRESDKDAKIMSIVEKFNEMADADLRTTSFEVEGEYNNIMPSVCFINSICAGMVYVMLKGFEGRAGYDFIFYTGEERPLFSFLRLRRDDGCMVCGTRD